MEKVYNAEDFKKAVRKAKKNSVIYWDERRDTIIKSPSDIKWKKKGKNYTTKINNLEDFLYIMYLVYQASEKEKREILIDVKLCKTKKNK
jgi:hypothetical protein